MKRIRVPPESSKSMGFWVKHREALNFYAYEDVEDSDTPEELREVFGQPDFRSLLDRIFDIGCREGDAVVQAIAERVAAHWRKQNRLVIEPGKKADDWRKRLVVRMNGAEKAASIHVGIRIETEATSGVTFYSYLWKSGGKATAEWVADCIRKANPTADVKIGRADRSFHWATGVVVIAAIPLSEFMEGDDLNCQRLIDVATRRTLDCRASALAKILS